MAEILHHLRLVVYPFKIRGFSTMPGGCFGMSSINSIFQLEQKTHQTAQKGTTTKKTMEASAEIMDHGDGISLLSPASKTPSLGVGRWCTVLAH